MDAVTIILVIGAVLAGLLLIWGAIALTLFIVGTKKMGKMQKQVHDDFLKGDPFDKPFFKNRGF